jgi:hypothetical protein
LQIDGKRILNGRQAGSAILCQWGRAFLWHSFRNLIVGWNRREFNAVKSFMKRPLLLFVFHFILSACTPAAPSATPEVVSVYSTAAAQPWLAELYDCAGTASVISRLDDPSVAEIVLRVGEPESLISPSFQIDTEEILVVTQRQSPIQNLSLQEARALFAGQGDPSIQVWVYAAGNDVRDVFNSLVMQGQDVSPAAMLAFDPQQMSDTLVNEANTVGILPRHWKVGDSRSVLSVGTVPVLAITPGEPQGEVKQLIACLQR